MSENTPGSPDFDAKVLYRARVEIARQVLSNMRAALQETLDDDDRRQRGLITDAELVARLASIDVVDEMLLRGLAFLDRPVVDQMQKGTPP